MTAAESYNRYCRNLFIAGMIIAGVVLAFAGCGCASAPISHNVYPAGHEAECVRGQNDAIQFFHDHYGPNPKVPFVAVYSESSPQHGAWGWTTDAHTIHIYHWDANTVCHEYVHTLKLYNGLGGGEENMP